MILFLSGCRLGAAPSDPHAPRAKYVFLFIGDGMAEVQVAAAGPEFERFPVRGRTTTHDIFRGVTDSAAAATAMATGHKTSSGVLGMNPLGTLSYASIAESARDAGYKVGIVTTVSLDHATPAAFYAKSARRDDYYGIARQIPASRFEYFGGGSLLKPEAFVLIATAGYAIVDDAATFRSLAPGTPPGSGKVVAVNAVLAGSGSMPYDIDRDSGDLSFADYVAKGIELLDGTAGFFMMAEAGKIDWACHANDAAAAIGEVRALDRAVAEALAFAEKHPGDVLVVVTGDHETGGMKYTPASGSSAAKIAWTGTGHTGLPVSTFASGTGQELFAGNYDNTDIFRKLSAVMGLSATPSRPALALLR